MEIAAKNRKVYLANRMYDSHAPLTIAVCDSFDEAFEACREDFTELVNGKKWYRGLAHRVVTKKLGMIEPKENERVFIFEGEIVDQCPLLGALE